MKILLADSSKKFTSELVYYCEKQGDIVEPTYDGLSALHLIEVFKYDLILLNQSLPQIDGLSLCKKLRSTSDDTAKINNRTPILLVSDELDSSCKIKAKVEALDLGADDYLTKPLSFEELMARARVLLRWSSSCNSPILEWQGVSLDSVNGVVKFNQQQVSLCRKEYDLLHLFFRNPSKLFSQSDLMDSLWDLEGIPTESTVRTHVKKLRRKLKEAGAEDIIETVYGLGYRLKQVQERTEASVAQNPKHQNWAENVPQVETNHSELAASFNPSPEISTNKVISFPRTPATHSRHIFTHGKFIQELNNLRKDAVKNNSSLSFISIIIQDFYCLDSLHGKDAKKQVITQISKLLNFFFRKDDIIGYHQQGGFTVGLYGVPRQFAERRSRNLIDTIQKLHFSSLTTENTFRVELAAEICSIHTGQEEELLQEDIS
jgi:DNA-binding response OmpR family regulator/GGDEF domain-containing protein